MKNPLKFQVLLQQSFPVDVTSTGTSVPFIIIIKGVLSPQGQEGM